MSIQRSVGRIASSLLRRIAARLGYGVLNSGRA